jgi:hypothetical protein
MKQLFQKLGTKDIITMLLWIILGFAWMQIDQIFLPESYQRFIAFMVLLTLFFYLQFRINRPAHIIRYANSVAVVVILVTTVIIVIQHVIITFDLQYKALLILIMAGVFPYIGAFIYKLLHKK